MVPPSGSATKDKVSYSSACKTRIINTPGTPRRSSRLSSSNDVESTSVCVSPAAGDVSSPLEDVSRQDVRDQRVSVVDPPKRAKILCLSASEQSPVSSPPTRSCEIPDVVLPLLFAALRAIIKALPASNDLPEVQALLALETLLKCTSPLKAS